MSADWFRRLSPAVRTLLVINIVSFLFQLLLGNTYLQIFGLIPQQVTKHHWWWQPLSYLFLHGGFLHLFLNMFALVMFGPLLENLWGKREFFCFYLLCGVGAGLLTVLFSPTSSLITIGASGAIYGILVGFAYLYPRATIYLYFFFPVNARQMVILFALLEFFLLLSFVPSTVARIAHLGGMLVAFLYLRLYYEWRYRIFQIIQRWPERFFRWECFLTKPFSRFRSNHPRVTQEQVDLILDKILREGVEKLSAAEHRLMEKYSQQQR